MLLIHSALAFFALAMAILTLWVKRSAWIWGGFLVLAGALALLGKRITPIALTPISSLFVLHTLLKGDVRGPARFVLFALAIALSLGLWMGSFPGFTDWPIYKKGPLSAGAAPFSYALSFGRPFIGIAVLAVGFPLIQRLRDLGHAIAAALPLILGGSALALTFALFSGLVRFDPKLPPIFWFFLVQNLVFVSIVEEAFWRGCVQKECFRAFGQKGLAAHASCVVLSALLSVAFSWLWMGSTHPLPFIFVTAILYGSVYQYTQSLEAAILTHWLLSTTHFALFTYPFLD